MKLTQTWREHRQWSELRIEPGKLWGREHAGNKSKKAWLINSVRKSVFFQGLKCKRNAKKMAKRDLFRASVHLHYENKVQEHFP